MSNTAAYDEWWAGVQAKRLIAKARKAPRTNVPALIPTAANPCAEIILPPHDPWGHMRPWRGSNS